MGGASPGSSQFWTSDGTVIEVEVVDARKSRTCLVFFPGALASALSSLYQMPIEDFVTRGCTVIRYNPRGHGRSRGVFSAEQSSNDFLEWWRQNSSAWDKVDKVIGVGHSLGASCLLAALDTIPILKAAVLVCPILDMRLSLTSMYEHEEQKAFANLFVGPNGPEPFVDSVLADDRWLDTHYWRENDLVHRLDYAVDGPGRIHFESVGRFLEYACHPGTNFVDLYVRNRELVTIFLAKRDIWFPIDRTEEVASLQRIPVVRPEGAIDHSFAGNWPIVWQFVLDKVLAK